jgi:hypothetical protein
LTRGAPKWKDSSMATAILAIVGVLVLVVGMPRVAASDEAKTPIRPLILNLSPAAQSYEAAFNQVIREDGPRPRSRGAGEVQPDGSVQYGSVNVTVKNPCPEGTVHYEPPPLPGRRARR